MAQPMFGGFSPDDFLRRLGMAGGQPPLPGLSPEFSGETPTPPDNRGAAARLGLPLGPRFDPSAVASQAGTKPTGGAPPQFGGLIPDVPMPADGVKSVSFDPAFTPFTPPPAGNSSGPSFWQQMAASAGQGGQTSQGSPFAPPGASQNNPQLPPFTPMALPEKTPFAPVQVEGAIRTGMHNPSAANPWDRSLTASSAEEELRLRQDAARNSYLDLIRPGGLGLPGTTGPIIGLQPHEAAMLANLSGRHADQLGQGRQIASTADTADRDMQLRALLSNQQSQTLRDNAALDSQTRLGVADKEAASRNNPNVLKLQLAGQYLAANKDPMALGEFMATMARHLPALNGGTTVPGAKGMDTDPITGGPVTRAAQAIRDVKPLFGSADANGGFKLDPNLMKPENLAKLTDTVASLPPEARAEVARQLHRGDLGPVNDLIDRLAGHVANNSLITQRPPTDQGGRLPGQYGIVAGEGATEPVVTLNAIPAGSWFGRRAQAVMGANNVPYNQLTVGGRAIPFTPSDLAGNRANLLGLGEQERRQAVGQTQKSATFLRELLRLQQAQNQPQVK